MKIITYILSFFIIFNFPIPLVHSSLAISIFVLLVIFLISKDFQKEIFKLLKNKFLFCSLLGTFLLIPIGISIAIIHETFDFSILKSNTLTIVTIVTTIFLFPLINKYVIKNQDNIKEMALFIINIMAIQSVIEILAFLSPTVLSIVRFFQKEIVINLGIGYNNLRALALTGNPFFSLSSAFGLTFILLFFSYSKEKEYWATLNFIYLFLLILIGSFFSGRTAFVGLIFGISYFLLSEKNILSKIKNLIIIILLITIFLLIFYVAIPDFIRIKIDNNLLPFIFEFLYNYSETGKLSTQSTDVLLNRMYFQLSFDTLLFGDGRYTNIDGSYYMHTDSGYMRNLLFYGLFGLVYIIIIQWSFHIRIFIIKEYRLLSIITFLYYLTLHYKGEALLYIPAIMSIQTLLLLASIKFRSGS